MRIPLLVINRSDLRFDWQDIVKHLKVGLPMGFQMSIIAIGAVILQVMLNTLGTNAVAAYTAAGRIDQLATLPSASFGVAMATFAAQNLGAKAYGRIRRGVYQTLLVNVGLSLVLGALIIVFSKPLVSMYWLLAILFTVRNLLQGLGQTLVPTVAGFFELGMRAFAAIFLVVPFGFAGASAANPLAWLGSVLVLVSSYIRTMRRIRQQEDTKTGEKA